MPSVALMASTWPSKMRAPPVDVLGIRRVRRRELAGDRELSGAQYPLENVRGELCLAEWAADSPEPVRLRKSLEISTRSRPRAATKDCPADAGPPRPVPAAACISPRKRALPATPRSTRTHFGRTSQWPIGAHAAARAVCAGSRTVHRARHAWSSGCIDIRQSNATNSSPFTERSTAATAARAVDSRAASQGDAEPRAPIRTPVEGVQPPALSYRPLY